MKEKIGNIIGLITFLGLAVLFIILIVKIVCLPDLDELNEQCKEQVTEKYNRFVYNCAEHTGNLWNCQVTARQVLCPNLKYISER